MHQVTCAKCGQGDCFMETTKPSKVGRDLVFIHCRFCGAVAGVVEQAASWNLVLQIAKKLGVSV